LDAVPIALVYVVNYNKELPGWVRLPEATKRLYNEHVELCFKCLLEDEGVALDCVCDVFLRFWKQLDNLIWMI
jgi:hypothetical protein